MERLPLYSYRNLDLTTAWAGPYGTRLLADMGAEVIKVEAVNNGDLLRSDIFNHVNRNKYACTLDLGQPRGRELFLRLVALSDVVIENWRSPVMESVGLSYDVNGVVQVQAVQRDTGHGLSLAVEPVPDDLSWLGHPSELAVAGEAERIRVFLLIDVSSSMIGQPLVEAQTAAREFLDRCDFTTMEDGLVSFSSLVALQCAATSNARRLHAAIGQLEAEGSTNRPAAGSCWR
jgi:hypothetical protein